MQYRIRLEDHEKALALPGISIVSTIPKPQEEWQEHCYPGQYERAETPAFAGYHSLETPSHKGHSALHTIKLPWRENNHYPEVGESFTTLRKKLEQAIMDAEQSLPMHVTESLQTTLDTKSQMAPSVLAERFLRLATKSQQSQRE